MTTNVTANEAWPGVFRMDGRFSAALNARYKEGIRWFDFGEAAGKKAWYLPESRLGEIRTFARNDLRVQWTETRLAPRAPTAHGLPLLPHQEIAYQRALHDRVLLFQGDTGTGKTLPCLALSRTLGRTLVVAPRAVVGNWARECTKWGLDDPTEIRSGRKTRTEQPDGMILCSYGMLRKLPSHYRFNLVIFDELHNAMHGTSARTKACVDLMLCNPSAVRAGLTATPVSTHLQDIYSQMHVLCPHRYGTQYQWTERYHITDQLGYEGARRVHGLRPERQEEWLATVGRIAYVVSQRELAASFPHVDMQALRIGQADRVARLPDSLRAWQAEASTHIDRRVQAIVDLQIPLDRPVAFVTYLRETASRLADALGIVSIDGSIPAHKRLQILAEGQPIVATMMSINEGLSLPQYTTVYLVESYPVPRYVEQVLGRFVRLGEREPVTVRLCELGGTSDSLISERLCRRIEEQRVVIQGSELRDGISSSLSLDAYSEDWLASVRDDLAGYTEESSGWLDEED